MDTAMPDRILLALPQDALAASLEARLQEDGFATETLVEGAEALARVQGSRFDCLVVGPSFAGLAWFDLVSELRAHAPERELPVLLFADLVEPEAVGRAFACGVTDIAQPSLGLDMVVHRLRRLVRSASTEKALRDTVTELNTAQRIASIGYWRWHQDTGAFDISGNLADMCGLQDPRVIDSLERFLDLVHPGDRSLVRAAIEGFSGHGEILSIGYRLADKSSGFVQVQQAITNRRRFEDDHVLLGTVQDVSGQLATEDRIRKLAFYDPLTGLASRGHLMQYLADRVRKANRKSEAFSVLFVDLDGFKDVNDSLGHDTGDYLLSAVARRLHSVIRDIDFVSRFGGDEFCVILDQADGPETVDAADVANRCLQAIGIPIGIGHAVIRPRASIGIARFPEDARSSGGLLKAADSAMYAAKRAGRNRYAFYQARMTREAEHRLQLEQAIRSALEHEQFELHYQPQIDTRTGRIVGVEALLRCGNEELAGVPASEMVAVAERIGLIGDLGHWVLRKAGEQIVEWRDFDPDELRLSVNISSYQLATRDLFDGVLAMLDETGINPAMLELEITEGAMQSNDKALELLGKLKAIGVRIAIDDFGTGYSSLGALKHLPIDTLKIDPLFIRGLLDNVEDSILLGTIVGLAHALGLRVVGEGVEHLEQVTILAGLGCDAVQGYLFSQPVDSRRVVELLKTSRQHSMIPKLPLKTG
jgi:diguanylate cyclase (GGDEF)-like protein